eukprot:g18542.t1
MAATLLRPCHSARGRRARRIRRPCTLTTREQCAAFYTEQHTPEFFDCKGSRSWDIFIQAVRQAAQTRFTEI